MAAFGRLPGEKPEISHLGFQQKLLSFGLLLLVFWRTRFCVGCFCLGWEKFKHDICHDMFMSIFSIKHLIAVPVSATSPGAPRSAKGCKASALTQPLWEQPWITTHPPWDSKKCTPLPETHSKSPWKEAIPKVKKNIFQLLIFRGDVSFREGESPYRFGHFLCILTFLAASAWSERATPSALCHWCHTPLPRACLQWPAGEKWSKWLCVQRCQKMLLHPPA